MTGVDDTIANIDALIDEQLAEGEPAGGFDDGDPAFPRCPHCGSHWHGLPITYRMVIMGKLGWMPDDYTYASDDSPIWCPGSQPDRRRLELDRPEMHRLVQELTAACFDAHMPTGLTTQMIAAAIHLNSRPRRWWQQRPRFARGGVVPGPRMISDGDTVAFTDTGVQLIAGRIRMRPGRGQEITTVIYDEAPPLFETPTTTEGLNDV